MTQPEEKAFLSSLWQEVINGPQSEAILNQAMYRAATSLSLMLNRPVNIDQPRIETIPINNVLSYGGDPEEESVGVYLLIDGDLQGQALLVLPIADALYMVDLLMGDEPGTATELDELANSAMAEMGNVVLAGFLNAVGELINRPVKPSPPAVVVDMLGTILYMIASSVAAMSDELAVVETTFKDTDRVLQLRFWVLPDISFNQ